MRHVIRALPSPLVVGRSGAEDVSAELFPVAVEALQSVYDAVERVINAMAGSPGRRSLCAGPLSTRRT
ncbi:MAG: hypothetical protein RLN70_07520, partial [Rhodospirillaceae bacterium]